MSRPLLEYRAWRGFYGTGTLLEANFMAVLHLFTELLFLVGAWSYQCWIDLAVSFVHCCGMVLKLAYSGRLLAFCDLPVA